jgi:K+-transporting ATPase KdpF subunit
MTPWPSFSGVRFIKMEVFMGFAIAALISAALIVYLIITIIHPEKF